LPYNGDMKLCLINVHLDLGAGRRGTDMGPSAIHVAGLVPAVKSLGHAVERVETLGVSPFEALGVGDEKARFLEEIAEVCARLADKTQSAIMQGLFPLVLGGDHSQAIGTVSGLSRVARERGRRLGVIWVDAHTDMNTPDSSPSGNIHGMPLATLLGHGVDELTGLVPGGPALAPESVVIIGARDVDATEIPLVKQTGVRVYTMSELDRRGPAVCIEEALHTVLGHCDDLHLSFDLDGVDPSHAPGVGTPVPGGLSLRESHLLCEMACKTGKLVGMEMVELNPTLDHENMTGRLAVWLIESALGRNIL
jgi:arginase